MTDNKTLVDLQPQFRRRPRPAGVQDQSVSSPPVLSALTSEEPTASAPTSDDKIGYGKPPKQHRFQPGVSGNPKGRPKGARGVNAMVREMLDQKTELTLGGKRRKVRYIKALLLKQLELASKGDWRALGELVKYYRAAVPDGVLESNAAITAASISTDEPDDDAILAAYREMVIEEAAALTGGTK